MTIRIKLRRDTAANWTTTNPILAAGEPGLETDTGKIKYGDGVTRWNVIEHTGGDALTNEGAITVQTGDADRWFVRLRREDNTINPEYTGVVVMSTNYDSEGNAIVAATIGLNDSGVAIFKFTPAGELVWKKSVDAVNDGIYLESNLVIDADDNIIFSVNPDASSAKFIVKLNGETGAVIFSEVLLFNNSFNIKAIAVDSNSNIIIGGHFYWTGNDGNETAFVAKLNPTATAITWQKSLSIESRFSYIKALEVDFNDDIIVAGYYDYDYLVNGQPTSDDIMMVAKITGLTGTVSWKKAVSLPESVRGVVTGISLDGLGNIYATGTYYVNNTLDNDGFNNSGDKSNAVVIFKMSTLGNVVWDRRVGPGQCDWVGVSTAVGEDGDLYLYASTYQRNPAGNADSGEGYWNATLALARYNKTTGAVIWQSYFDNPKSQDVPAWGSDSPWSGYFTDLMTVKGDKILIGGSVRFGQSDADLAAPWSPSGEYFNQGFLAQFDTDATPWSAEGWTLSTSRIPGMLTNTLTAVDSDLALQDSGINIGLDGSANTEALAVGVSVRRTASKVNTWTFGKDGTFSAPDDANIKLNQKQLGYATLYGTMDNSNENIWFESVTHDSDGFAYVVGSNNWQSGKTHLFKFTPEGAKVWACQLHSGSGAAFYVEWNNNEYTVATVDSTGLGYKVGDKIVIPGNQLGGTNGVNSLTLQVTAISNSDDNGAGGISTVNIVSGVAIDGSSDTTASDPYDDAESEIVSIAFQPVTGNPIVLITTPTYNGDTMDNQWTESVLLTIDSGSGAVLGTTTLKDEGDIYAQDIAISSTGVRAVVGEKYNEYNEYGSITPLTGSGVDEFWVLKSDIDAEHFPGELNGNVYDWWITGTGITDQAQVFGVNDYQDLDTTVREGSGAAFTVEVNGAVINTESVMGDMVVASQAFSTYTAYGYSSVTNPTFGSTTATSLAELYYIDEAPTPYTRLTLTPGVYSGFTVTANGLIANSPVALTFIVVNAGAQMTPEEVSPGVWVYFNRTGDVFNLGLQNTQTLAVKVGYSDIPNTPGTYSVLVTNGGTNYLAGHKVKVLGSALGGTTPENDVIITVDAVDAGAITSVSRTGDANVAAVGPYTTVAHANYNVGSGYLIDMIFSAITGAYGDWFNASSGQNYVVGDILTISGTQFAGGASTANDITFRVSGIGGSGDINNIDTITGSIPTTHLLLTTDYGVDFAPGENSFAIKQNLQGEAFIWTEDWTKAIGGNNSDWFSGVVWNAAGTSVYAVGTGRYDVNYDQALVIKYSSTGTLQASKFINGDMSSNNATKGAVALMADDSIVVVHQQYNPYRDQVDEILVTKLDSDLNILWQQFIGVQDEDGDWESPDGTISVAVDPATDEILLAWAADEQTSLIDDYALLLLKLDTDGEVLWKRVFGIHESDTYVGQNSTGNKFLSIHGDQFTVVGRTDGPDNSDIFNAFIVTLPLDGTGVGLHGLWTYAEPTDEKIKVWRLSNRTSTTFTPNVHSGAITYVDNLKYYYNDYPTEEFTFYPEVIRSNQGGALEFADGSKQTFSTALIPQVKISAGRYVIRPEDSGRHILVEEYNYAIIIPNWQKVTLPVGFTFTIINISNTQVTVENESANDFRGQMWFSGGDDKTPAVGITDNGSGQMVTLIKIKEGTGYSDDGDNHGDIWMIAGADIINTD